MALDVEILLDHMAALGPGPAENAYLQASLRAAFELMEPSKRVDFLASEPVATTLEGAFFEGTATDVETLIGAARTHGDDSDPDHEAGDLQDFLRAAFDHLDEEKQLLIARIAGFEQSAPSP